MDPLPASELSAALLTRAQAGDESALATLVGRYMPRLRRWATGRLPPNAREVLDTDDVVQDTVIGAVRNLKRIELRGDGAIQAYLRRSLANRLTDLYRRHGNRPRQEQADSRLPAPLPSPLDEAIGREAVERYERALGRLSDRDRQAIILRIEMVCGYPEIADALSMSGPDHARVIVSRALARLAREMADEKR